MGIVSASYSWLGLSPMVWSLLAMVGSVLELWWLGRIASRVQGWARLMVGGLAGFFQFVIVLCGLTALVVHMSPRLQVVAIFLVAVGFAVWRAAGVASTRRGVYSEEHALGRAAGRLVDEEVRGA